MNPAIREATAADLPAINAIYNHYVATSTATYDESPVTLAEREAWWVEHQRPFEVLVLDHAGLVAGWASMSSFRSRCAYRYTCEDSIYLRPEIHGRGWGKRLLGVLLDRAAASGAFRSCVAGVSADQTASIRLHEAAGFQRVAHLREVGFKFGRWLDVVYLQRFFDAADR
ncbi:MAG: N-acetyltransferase family protein [Phycisphaerae bacterium]